MVMFKKNKAVKNKAVARPVPALVVEEVVEKTPEETEGVEEPTEEELPEMPEPAPLTKEEVIGLAEGHLARASELLVYSRSVK